MKSVLLITGEESLFNDDMFIYTGNKLLLKKGILYKSNSIINKILRNLPFRISRKSLNVDILNTINSSDIIIMFDCVCKKGICKYLKIKFPDKKFIIYFRNKISSIKKKNIDVSLLKKWKFELWSYNLLDCKNYNMYLGNQFFNEIYLNNESLINNNEIYDTIFIGSIKNRLSIIKKIHKILENKQLRNFFYLVPYSQEYYDKNINNQYLDYINYLQILNKSNSIIDIVSKENYGLTLRPIEALFFKKKLITNYIDINKYDFYNSNNVFIIGKDNFDDILDFMHEPYNEISDDIIIKYSFNYWLENITRNEETDSEK